MRTQAIDMTEDEMHSSIARKPRVILAAMAAVATAVVALLVAAHSSAVSTSGEGAPGPQLSVLESAAPGALASLPREAQMLLNQAQGLLDVSDSGMSGDNISATSVQASPDGAHVAVAAIGDNVCIVQLGLGGACGDRSAALRGQVFGARPNACGGYHVFGLMPDGVTELMADMDGDRGADRYLPVRSNVYSATLGRENTRLASQDGSVTVDIPLDVYAKANGAC